MATIQDVIDGKIDIPESERLLGVKVIGGDMATNEVVCEWTIEEQHLNRAGIALGGFTAAVADVAIGYAGALVMEEGYTFTSVNLVTTFHRPIHLGTFKTSWAHDALRRSRNYTGGQARWRCGHKPNDIPGTLKFLKSLFFSVLNVRIGLFIWLVGEPARVR